MKRKQEERTLTRAEMEIMNILWDGERGMTTHEIIGHYPEPHPAYSTIATFLKILTNKGFVASHRVEGGGKTFCFKPLVTREAYTSRVMKEVKSTLFGGSLKSMFSFFARHEDVSEEDLREILEMIK